MTAHVDYGTVYVGEAARHCCMYGYDIPLLLPAISMYLPRCNPKVLPGVEHETGFSENKINVNMIPGTLCIPGIVARGGGGGPH